MTRSGKGTFVIGLCVVAALRIAATDGLDPALILKPLADSWLTYSGDYSGRRYSALTQLDQSNVKNLSLAWVAKMNAGPMPNRGPSTAGAMTTSGAATIVGGEGTGEIVVGGATQIKGSILQVNGVLYVTAPDNVWAVDARDGHDLWHYFWKTKGGTHIGNRGVGVWRNDLFFVTPDDYLISLDAGYRGRSGGTRRSRRSASSIS